ncbi:MAG: acyltransferase [Gammaproteobacteria bacterium]|nr:MAG: acyltransferase [Gammaproteobacteria bacterium]
MLFRKDINGLRALAVIAVVLFHFNIAGADGGFSGVDMFFVISGYLMTSIIFGKLDKNNFSILEFYLARARRIIPALLFLCVALLIAGWFFLPPTEYKILGKQTLGASTFLSNFIFLKETGYFESASHEKWLLHTWSLSVEWQFYIIYPIAIVLIRAIFPTHFSRWFVLAGALLSFALSVSLPPSFSAFEFYMLPTRAWEMMAGGLIYFFAPKASPKFSLAWEWLGITIILGSILFLDASMGWPGVYTLVPVIGVALVMFAKREASIVTGNPLAQYLGKISYSLYLWHWPIVVVLHIYGVFDNVIFKLSGVVVSLLFAHLSHAFIESPWRLNANVSSRISKGMHRYQNHTMFMIGRYAVASFVVTLSGFAIFKYGGFASRVDNFVYVADAEQENRNPRVECFVSPSANPKSPMCVFGKKTATISSIVIGDSHANATVNAIADSLPENRGGVLFLGADGCSAMMNLSNEKFYTCGAYNKNILKFLSENLPGVPVIIVNHITDRSLRPTAKSQRVNYLDGVPNTNSGFAELFVKQYQLNLCDIAKKRPVYITQPIPEMDVFVPQAIARAKLLYKKEIDVSTTRDFYLEDNKFIRNMIITSAEHCSAKIMDPSEYLCGTGNCLGSINGRPLYYDDDHLSEYGNRLLIPMFKTIWEDSLTDLVYQGATARN